MSPVLVKIDRYVLPNGRPWRWFYWTCRLCGNEGSKRTYHFRWREVAYAGVQHVKRSHPAVYAAMREGRA